MGARLAVGIVGAGRIGAKRAAAVASSATARLVAFADADPGRAGKLASDYGCAAPGGWEAMVERHDLDAIVVATPHRWLAPISKAALDAGRHVLAEKPLARNAGEAAPLVAAAQARGRVLQTGFNHRYHPALAEAHRLAAAGEIGRLLHIRCRYGHGGRAWYAA